MQKRRMRSRILEFAWGEQRTRGSMGEGVEGEIVDFRKAGAEEGAGEVFEAFELGLEDYEGEGGCGGWGGGEGFDEGDLLTYTF